MVRVILLHFDAFFVHFDKLIRRPLGPLWGALGVLWGHGGCLGHPMGPSGCFDESSDDSCGIYACDPDLSCRRTGQPEVI